MLLSEREANEMAKHGEVLNESSGEEIDVREDTPHQTTRQQLNQTLLAAQLTYSNRHAKKWLRQSQQTQTQSQIMQFRRDLSQEEQKLIRESHMLMRQSNKTIQVRVRTTYLFRLCLDKRKV